MTADFQAWWDAQYGQVEALLIELAREHEWLTPPLSFCAILKAQYMPLVHVGADPDVLDRILTVLAQDPRHRFLVMLRTGTPVWLNRRAESMLRTLSLDEWGQAHEELVKIVPRLEALERLFENRSFTDFPVPFQAYVLHELRELSHQFRRLILPIYHAWQQADADPLVRLLEQDRPTIRRRGRPSHRISTAAMALISRHLQDRVGHRHARVVGEVTHALFPSTFASKARQPAGWSAALCTEDTSLIGVEERVGDRLRKFGYDLDAMLAAL